MKLVLLAAVLIPAGFLTRNLLVGFGALVVAIVLVVVGVRRRRRCDGACHLPSPRGDEERSGQVASS